MMSEEVSDDVCSTKNKTFKVCKHARGWVLGDRGWTGRVGNHVLIDFIIFKILRTSNLDISAKIMKTWKKSFRVAGVIMSTSSRRPWGQTIAWFVFTTVSWKLPYHGKGVYYLSPNSLSPQWCIFARVFHHDSCTSKTCTRVRHWSVMHITGKESNLLVQLGERGCSVVESRTPEREVGGSKPTATVLCSWARHFTPQKYWLITQEAVAPSRHDWKIVDWDVKPQHKQTKIVQLANQRMNTFGSAYVVSSALLNSLQVS